MTLMEMAKRVDAVRDEREKAQNKFFKEAQIRWKESYDGFMDWVKDK